MTVPCVITEGATDETILRALLPSDVVGSVQFVPASGRYSAISLARSILAVKQRPVALVLDADTLNPKALQERESSLEETVGGVSPGIPYLILLAVSEIEGLLVGNQAIAEELLGVSLSVPEYYEIKMRPKQRLGERFGKTGPAAFEAALGRLSPATLAEIRKDPVVERLSEFLSGLPSNVS